MDWRGTYLIPNTVSNYAIQILAVGPFLRIDNRIRKGRILQKTINENKLNQGGELLFLFWEQTKTSLQLLKCLSNYEEEKKKKTFKLHNENFNRRNWRVFRLLIYITRLCNYSWNLSILIVSLFLSPYNNLITNRGELCKN